MQDVCIYECTHAYIHVYMCIYAYKYIYIYISINMILSVCVSPHLRTWSGQPLAKSRDLSPAQAACSVGVLDTYIHIYIYTCVYLYIYVYTHAYMHTICTYTHTLRLCSCSSRATLAATLLLRGRPAGQQSGSASVPWSRVEGSLGCVLVNCLHWSKYSGSIGM